MHALRVEGRVSERERDEAVRETLRLLGIDDIENEIIGDEQRRGTQTTGSRLNRER